MLSFIIRTCLLTGVFVLFASACTAQAVPGTITYQGKLTNASGVPVPDVNHTLNFRIYAAQSGGAPIWSSADVVVQPKGGLFTAELGPINPSDLGTGEAWVEVSVNGTALPRTKLNSSPYALRAADLRLPFNRTHSSPNFLISLVNPVGGVFEGYSYGYDTAYFEYDNPTGLFSALYARSNTDNSTTAYFVQTGIGSAAVMDNYNSSATNPTVIAFSSSSQPGVRAQNFSQINSAELASSTAGVYATQGNTQHAGYFSGNVRVTGDLTVNGQTKNQANESMVSIAYGNMTSTGGKYVNSSTANVSSSWNPVQSWYEITITGHTYIFSDYVTLVTPIGSTPRFAGTTSVSGRLVVVISDINGNRVQNAYQFVTYKK